MISRLASLALPVSLHTLLKFRLFASAGLRSGGKTIYSVPNEVFVNVVLPYLELYDILRLRRVCKLFYDLTHHASVWKRLLRFSRCPLPPLPPTSRHKFANLTALEAERLYIRAYSLDQNWRRDVPEAIGVWSFPLPGHVAEMVLLPGSRYIVASVSDTCKLQWDILLCSLDSRYGVVQIAKTSTKTKAYHLQARYMTVNGVSGITIAYLRRDWVHRKDGKRGINVSEYSPHHDIDTPYEIKHECVTLHVSLDLVEALDDSRLLPGSRAYIEKAKTLPSPFQQLCLIRSRSRNLTSIVLCDFAPEEPYLTVVKQPNSIVFKPLNGGPVSLLNLQPHQPYAHIPHTIEAVRPLPQQNQVLIIRKIQHVGLGTLCFEMYDIPTINSSEEVAVTLAPGQDGGYFLHGRRWSSDNIFITEAPSPGGINADESDALHEPLPVSVFVSTTHPWNGIQRFVLAPERVGTRSARRSLSSPEHHYYFRLGHATRIFSSKAPETLAYRSLPGSLRTLVYTVPKDSITEMPQISGLFKYPHEDTSEGDPSVPICEIGVGFHVESKISAIAWDGTAGRACFANQDQGCIKVIDFAHVVLEDVLGRRSPVAVPCEHDPSFDDNLPPVCTPSSGKLQPMV